MADAKMSAEQMTRYYSCVHQEALKRDRGDSLSAVIAPDANAWVNRFTDFAHRLGMRRVFTILAREWGSLANRSVLDLGCGRGRWSKEYAARGAFVTGADISPEAISIVAEELPQHRFVAGDITDILFPDENFDLVNSVTVLQHMPEPKQRTALSKAARALKPGGYLILFENILAFDAPHVFPHRTGEWIRMAEATGLKCTHSWGSNFEPLIRAAGVVSKLLRGTRETGSSCSPLASPGSSPQSLGRRFKSGVLALVAVLSFPVERFCYWLALVTPTHSVMVFRKEASL